MVRGVVYAILACFLWGFIFIIPQMVTGFSALEVVLGRYIVYGIISTLVLFRKGFTIPMRYSHQAWGLAFVFSLMSNLLYYSGIVLSMKLASAPITIVIAGLAPISVSLYGNWHVRELSYKHMIFPSLWILLGVGLVNYSDLMNAEQTSTIQAYIVGVFLALLSLSLWTLFAIHNARFLKRHPEIAVGDWVSVIGTATLVSSFAVWVICAILENGDVHIHHYLQWNDDMVSYLGAVLFLGLICSWWAFNLWNKAGLYLPLSMLGPLVIFEFIFGLIDVYIFEWRLPSLTQFIGILTLLSGTFFALYTFRKKAYKT